MQDADADVTLDPLSNDEEMNKELEEKDDEEMIEERTATLNVDILDCLLKSRKIRKTGKSKGLKRKAPVENWGPEEKKSHIVYLNEASKTEEEEVEDSGSSEAVLVNEWRKKRYHCQAVSSAP